MIKCYTIVSTLHKRYGVGGNANIIITSAEND